jgi:two-component system, LytTR family, response regulator
MPSAFQSSFHPYDPVFGASPRSMEENQLRVVIVDDEPLARKKIRAFLEGAEGVNVVAESTSVEEAVNAIATLQPDLVFLDVQLANGNGFEVVEEIGSENMPITVFVTAHEEFAVKAFEAHAFDYLLKPFSEERFRGVLERVQDRSRQRAAFVTYEDFSRLLSTVSMESRYPKRLMVRTGSQYEAVRVSDIIWIEASNNYVTLHLANRSHLLRQTMSRIQMRLDPSLFIRVQRSAIVNLDRVQAVRPYSGVEYQIIMDNGEKILSGRSYREEVRRALLRE